MPVEIDGSGSISGLSAPTEADQASPKSFVETSVESSDTLAELNDTTISSPADGETLVYNSAASVFENKPTRIKTYADAATRTSSSPTPAEGDLSYLQDTDAVEVYDGSAWVSVAPAPTNVGKVLQVVTATDLSTRTYSGSGYIDAGISVSITPVSATSTLYIYWSYLQYRSGGAGALTMNTRIADSLNTPLVGAENFGWRIYGGEGGQVYLANPTTAIAAVPSANTSARTYKGMYQNGTIENGTVTGRMTVWEVEA